MNPFLRETPGRPIPQIKPPAAEWKEGASPPEFIVDLDLPPENRWEKVLEWGTPLLQSVVYKFNRPKDQSLWDNELMQGIERRYQFSNDQYAEMQGIANITGIPFDKIRDYNLVLTSQFGCTSGTVPLMEQPSRLLHFRVLDPAIALPQLLIQAHFVRRRALVASAIMHVGHVAITTGVRKGLSISINTKKDYVRSYGVRKWSRRYQWAMYDPWCIATRDLLLRESLPSLSTAKAELKRGMPDAYFSVVSDGRDAASLDGPNFEEQKWREPRNGVLVQGDHYPETDDKFILEGALPGSLALMEQNAARVRRLESIIKQSMEENSDKGAGAGVKIPDLLKWVTSPPVKQGITTLSCIMDPTEGNILWATTFKGRRR
jgi:hypothetical protein